MAHCLVPAASGPVWVMPGAMLLWGERGTMPDYFLSQANLIIIWASHMLVVRPIA